MVSIAVLVLRRTHLELPRGVPLPGVPLVPVLGGRVSACS